MEMKFAQVVNKGMQRDYAMNTASQEFAYENKNIRITTTGDESFLAVSNEKSTIPIKLQAKDLPYRDASREEKIQSEILKGHKLCFINVKQPTEIIVYFTRTIYYPDNSIKLEQNIPHKVLVTPGVEEETDYGTKILVTYTDITESFDELLNVEGAKEVHILRDFYFNTVSGYIPIGKNEFSYSNFFNDAIIYGGTVCGEYLVLFTKVSVSDLIFRAKIDSVTTQSNTMYCELVYSGSLDFNYDMEFTTYYESEDVQKVYWVDGKNQPRVINICELHQTSYTTNLDFVPKIDVLPIVNVEKQYEGRGIFPSGVIQYYITYYNKFGQESNAVHVTPLYNISPSDRGGAEDETQTCSFKIHIENVDNHYDNIRIYSYIRTSLNAAPVVSIVGDLEINKENSAQYYEIVDDNYGNINVPASDILFLGGNTISASTIEQKDNTLFLGNISSIANNDDYTELKKVLENNRTTPNRDGLSFVSRPIADKEAVNDDYGYAPNMDNSSKDRGFKYLEWYRFGLQFQSDTGEWGNTLWLNDKQNPLRPDIVAYDENKDVIIQKMYDKVGNFHSLAAVKFEPTEDIKNIINKYNSKYYRLVMAEHNDLSRTVKTQGIIMPTIFNLQQRYDNTVFGIPAWSTSIFKKHSKHYDNIDYFQKHNENNPDNVDFKYTNIYPTQQLDSALYELEIINPNDDNYGSVNNYALKILPSATKNTNGVFEYLKYIDVQIQLVRKAPGGLENNPPDYITEDDIKAAKNSPHGNVVQDMFFFRVTPYVDSNGEVSPLTTYTLREFRLAGKIKNTLESLIKEACSKTWRDYTEATEDTVSGVAQYDKILNSLEIISADNFDKNRKKNSVRTSHIEKFKLYRNGTLDNTQSLVDTYKNQYFIDSNLCNMWCPNIDNINLGNYKFRIVGTLDISNTISDYELLTENSTIEGTTYSAYKTIFNRYEYAKEKPGITSFPLWESYDTKSLMWVYPWNQDTLQKNTRDNNVVYAPKIKNKIFANLWKTNTTYIDNINYEDTTLNKYEDNTVYIEGNLYQGKYQNVLFPLNTRRAYIYSEEGITKSTDFKYIDSLIKNNQTAIQNEANEINDSINIKYSSTPHLVLNLGKHNGFLNTLPNYEIIYDEGYTGNVDIATKIVYPTGLKTILYSLSSVNNGDLFKPLINKNSTNTAVLTESWIGVPTLTITNVNNKSASISFRFSQYGDMFKNPSNSEEFAIKNEYILCNLDFLLYIEDVQKEGNITTIKFSYYDADKRFIVYNNKIAELIKTSSHSTIKEFNQEGITTTNFNEWSFDSKLFLGELYTEYDPTTFMGGNTENALELNTFIPISNPTPIGETIYGFEGDTYYQQWDCLRTYPTSEEDTNKIVDVVSAMIETTVNLDGDTRKTRGRSDMINVRPSNMVNQINTVYSQSNNYMTSKILDEKFKDSTHPLQYWWSLTKTPNADIDTWTGVNLTSVAELDGDKGPLNKIKRWNNQLYAFQDKGIALINFNNQTTVSTQEGLPVEIQNSGKVSGHYYIITNNGCKNKWSIVESPNGLYFIDGYNVSINVIGDGIKSLSQLNLFQDWIEQKEKDPDRIANGTHFKGFYDPIHKEVYFADDKDCICYNELLQQFTSFYDYQNMRNMFVASGHVYTITSEDKIYKMFEGNDYCNLFDKQCDYYMQYKINNEPFIDKTWTNLEYRADIFDRGNIQTNEFDTNDIVNNETFDSLKVWNEYQNGELDLTTVRFGYLKDAKPKFRIWRTNLPRAKATDSTNKFGLDRIRNPWIMLELKKTGDTSKRMEFHDLVIKYVI